MLNQLGEKETQFSVGETGTLTHSVLASIAEVQDGIWAVAWTKGKTAAQVQLFDQTGNAASQPIGVASYSTARGMHPLMRDCIVLQNNTAVAGYIEYSLLGSEDTRLLVRGINLLELEEATPPLRPLDRWTFEPVELETLPSGQLGSMALSPLVDGGFVAVWQAFPNRSVGNEIRAQAFDPDGTSRFNPVVVHSVSRGSQIDPAVAPLGRPPNPVIPVSTSLDGAFLVTWSDDRDGNGYWQIYARGFNSDGTERIPEMVVNEVAAGQQRDARVTRLIGGGFAVTWADDRDLNGFWQVYVRGFNADGSEAFPERVIHTVANGQQEGPAIVGLRGGGFVVAWDDDRDETSVYTTFIRGFDPNGLELFSERPIFFLPAIETWPNGQQVFPYGRQHWPKVASEDQNSAGALRSNISIR